MFKPYHKGHVSIPFHTKAQAKKFFVAAADLGYSADEVKERAKAHFKVECFNALNINQLSNLIDRMVQQQQRRYENS